MAVIWATLAQETSRFVANLPCKMTQAVAQAWPTRLSQHAARCITRGRAWPKCGQARFRRGYATLSVKAIWETGAKRGNLRGLARVPERQPHARTIRADLRRRLPCHCPGIVAGLVPWQLTGRYSQPISSSPVITLPGAVLVGAGILVLLDAFARVALEGAGTPAPIAPTERLVVGRLRPGAASTTNEHGPQ